MKAIPWLRRSSCIILYPTFLTASRRRRTRSTPAAAAVPPPVSFAPSTGARALTTSTTAIIGSMSSSSSDDDPPPPPPPPAGAAAAGAGGGGLPRVDEVQPVASTKWLALQTLQWTDQDGRARQWDMATRTTKQSHDAADAVVVVPLLRHKGDGDGNNPQQQVDTLLVEQYRPPVRRTTVEFPAGLIDEGETVEQAALRELREETGYVGEACREIAPSASRATCMSPGLCDETVQVVLVEVDLGDPRNRGTPKPELDPGEHCVVKRVSLQEGMKQILDQGTAMPIMGLYLFALGWELGAASAATSLKKEARN